MPNPAVASETNFHIAQLLKTVQQDRRAISQIIYYIIFPLTTNLCVNSSTSLAPRPMVPTDVLTVVGIYYDFQPKTPPPRTLAYKMFSNRISRKPRIGLW